jgi:hypothetical protein
MRIDMGAPIIHLLIPKEFRVWCRPNNVPSAEMQATMFPSKSSCAMCLTRFRRKTGTGRGKTFRVKWTDRFEPCERDPKED